MATNDARSERERLADQKMREMKEKNARLQQRHKEVEEDKQRANVEQVAFDKTRQKSTGATEPKKMAERNVQQKPNNRRPPGMTPNKKELELKMSGRERENYTKWRSQQSEIDEQRLTRARTSDGSWKREWDSEKEPINEKSLKTPPPPSPGQHHSFASGSNSKPQFTPPHQQAGRGASRGSPSGRGFPAAGREAPANRGTPSGRGRGRGISNGGVTSTSAGDSGARENWPRGPLNDASRAAKREARALSDKKQPSTSIESNWSKPTVNAQTGAVYGGPPAGFTHRTAETPSKSMFDRNKDVMLDASPTPAELEKRFQEDVPLTRVVTNSDVMSGGSSPGDLNGDWTDCSEDEEEPEAPILIYDDTDASKISPTVEAINLEATTTDEEDCGKTEFLAEVSKANSLDAIERDMIAKLDSNIAIVEESFDNKSDEELELIYGAGVVKDDVIRTKSSESPKTVQNEVKSIIGEIMDSVSLIREYSCNSEK